MNQASFKLVRIRYQYQVISRTQLE